LLLPFFCCESKEWGYNENVKRNHLHHGFTLVELLIIVILLGLLSTIAISSFGSSREETRRAAFVASLKSFSSGIHASRVRLAGDFPDDQYPGVVPPEAAPYLDTKAWTSTTPLGGRWDWECDVFGITAGISVVNPDVDSSEMALVDSLIDDGNLATGSFRRIASRYIFVLQE
jgi:prepilin-type N-terminal cleavage/methylation domain-containing protein